MAMGDLLQGFDETDEVVMKDSLRDQIRRILKTLSPRDAQIVKRIFLADLAIGLRRRNFNHWSSACLAINKFSTGLIKA